MDAATLLLHVLELVALKIVQAFDPCYIGSCMEDSPVTHFSQTLSFFFFCSIVHYIHNIYITVPHDLELTGAKPHQVPMLPAAAFPTVTFRLEIFLPI
jgi:hypothetical protein